MFHAPRTHFQTQKNENQILENAILKISVKWKSSNAPRGCLPTKNARDTLMTINNLTPGFLSFCPFINNKIYLLKLYLLYLFIKTITKKCQPCWFIILWQSYGVIFSSMEGENGVNLRTRKNIVHRKLARMK